MASGTLSISLALGGTAINRSVTRTTDAAVAYEVSLPAGKAGTLSTRTDSNTGILTVASGHGITDADTVDVFWTGGNRYGMTVTAYDSTTISIDLGAGTNLPDAATSIVVTKEVSIVCQIDGDNASLIGVCSELSDLSASSAALVNFLDVSAASVAAITLVGNVPRIWDITGGATNSFTGNVITNAKAANASTSATATLKILALVDSTP